eukprot:g13767.t1
MGPGLCGRWVQRKKVLKTWMTTIEVGTAYKQCIAAAKLSTRLVKVVGHTFDHLLFCQHRRLNNEAQRVKESLPLPEEMTFPKKAIQVSKDLGNTTRRHVFVMGPEGSATRLWTMLLAKGLHLDLRMLNTAHSDHIYNDQAALFHISLPNGGSCKKDFDFSREPLLTDFGGDAAAYAEKAVTTRSLRPMQKLPFFWLDPKELLEKHHQRGDPITVVLVIHTDVGLVFSAGHGNHAVQAYELMLKAFRSRDPSVHVVCYEDFVDDPTNYVPSRLSAMGLNVTAELGAEDGNEEFALKGYDCQSDMTKVTQKNFETPGWKGGKGREIPKGFESWSDYTRYALEGIKVNGPVGPTADQAKNKDYRPTSLVDRKSHGGAKWQEPRGIDGVAIHLAIHKMQANAVDGCPGSHSTGREDKDARDPCEGILSSPWSLATRHAAYLSRLPAKARGHGSSQDAFGVSPGQCRKHHHSVCLDTGMGKVRGAGGSMGVDFGPSFVGLALSLGGVNTMPMGTLRTGEDWKELAIKIAKIASTQRVKDVRTLKRTKSLTHCHVQHRERREGRQDIVVGQPLERDGSEGKIGKLVRYFVQVLADACLLMLGNEVTVYMWDERFSTTYAAMRLGNRPRFDGEAFKRWITVRQGLNWGAKALLDSEAMAWDGELSERVAPSREACMRYLKYRKVRAALPPAKDLQPEEPRKEAWEWYDRHPESYEVDEEEHQSATSAFNDYMAGLDGFGDKESATLRSGAASAALRGARSAACGGRGGRATAKQRRCCKRGWINPRRITRA